MNSILLQLTSSYLRYILYILAIWFLLKGHNQPGGGFIAGLLLSSGFLLNMLANGLNDARKNVFMNPVTLTVVGVITSLFFSILPILFNKTFFEGMWLPEFSLPLLGAIHIGTPLFFDLGVFMAVIGFTVSVIFDLEKAE